MCTLRTNTNQLLLCFPVGITAPTNIVLHFERCCVHRAPFLNLTYSAPALYVDKTSRGKCRTPHPHSPAQPTYYGPKYGTGVHLLARQSGTPAFILRLSPPSTPSGEHEGSRFISMYTCPGGRRTAPPSPPPYTKLNHMDIYIEEGKRFIRPVE